MMRRKSSPNPPNACGSYFFDLHSTFPPSTLCTVSSFSLQLSRLAPGLPPGSHSYTNLIDGKTYSVDFSKATYNWDRLVFAYGSDAVGLLAHMVERLLKAKCRLEEVRAVEASVLKKS